MPRNLSSSPLMRPLVVLALPGMYLFYKYSQYKRQQQEQNRRRVTERELAHLNHKIDKLLSKLEENEPEMATSQEDECVICVNAKATMQTSPCGHRVVCRKCFVKTIQMAVSQRLLPLRCVICRAKILRLKASGRMVTSASHYSVPNSESLYSMSSGSSSFSGVSSSSAGSSCSNRSQRTYRQPTGSLRKSQTQSMKYHLQEYKEPRSSEKTARLPPIQEFQREYRLGKERSSSTRIRCAQKIVTQLETTPVNTAKPTSFFRASSSGPNHKEDRTRSEEKRVTPSRSSSQSQASSSSAPSQSESKKPEKVKQEKKEKVKEKELSKAEKKEQKKEAKAEKKNAKKESKNEKKDKKENNDSKKQ